MRRGYALYIYIYIREYQFLRKVCAEGMRRPSSDTNGQGRKLHFAERNLLIANWVCAEVCAAKKNTERLPTMLSRYAFGCAPATVCAGQGMRRPGYAPAKVCVGQGMRQPGYAPARVCAGQGMRPPEYAPTRFLSILQRFLQKRMARWTHWHRASPLT